MVFGIWYLQYQIPSPKKVFGKVFKYPKINMYLVFYLNTNFWVFDTTLPKIGRRNKKKGETDIYTGIKALKHATATTM